MNLFYRVMIYMDRYSQRDGCFRKSDKNELSWLFESCWTIWLRFGEMMWHRKSLSALFSPQISYFSFDLVQENTAYFLPYWWSDLYSDFYSLHLFSLAIKGKKIQCTKIWTLCTCCYNSKLPIFGRMLKLLLVRYMRKTANLNLSYYFYLLRCDEFHYFFCCFEPSRYR